MRSRSRESGLSWPDGCGIYQRRFSRQQHWYGPAPEGVQDPWAALSTLETVGTRCQGQNTSANHDERHRRESPRTGVIAYSLPPRGP